MGFLFLFLSHTGTGMVAVLMLVIIPLAVSSPNVAGGLVGKFIILSDIFTLFNLHNLACIRQTDSTR